MAKNNTLKVMKIVKKVILWSLLAAIVIILLVNIIQSFGSGIVSSNSSVPTTSAITGDYKEYVDSKESIYPKDYKYDIVKTKNKAVRAEFNQGKTDLLNGVGTSSATEVKTRNGHTGAFKQDGKTYDYTYSASEGSLAFDVNAPEKGFYNILIKYLAMDDFKNDGTWEKSGGADIERGIKVNGDYPYASLENVIFTRTWHDAGKVLTDLTGNQIKPTQGELFRPHTSYISDRIGYITEPYLVFLEKGNNEIVFESIKETMGVIDLYVTSKETYKKYDEYAEEHKDKKKVKNVSISVEGEVAMSRSSSTIFAINDKSNARTRSEDGSYASPVKLILNTIGGNKWTSPGSWINWQIDVPEDGLYQISMRTKQNVNRGLFSTRKVLIDEQIPFAEAQNAKYIYGSEYSIVTLGSSKDKPFYFYLTKGKHDITLECTLGDYATQIGRVQTVINELNSLYRAVIKRTGMNPDPYIDYFTKESGKAFIEEATKIFQRSVDTLYSVEKTITKISGEKSSQTTSLETMAIQLEQFVNDYRKIQKGLKRFSTNIASLGTWILNVSEQPLTVDWIVVHSDDYKLGKANANSFISFFFNVRGFVGSFFFDYESVGLTEANKNWRDVDVWLLTSLTTGREQANAISSMIYEAQNEAIQSNDTNNPLYGLNIKLKVVDPGVLLTATLSGNGPDIALNVANGTPVNYALRGAVHDISGFSDFEATLSRFMQSSMTPYSYTDANGHKGTYALPYTQSFLVMFYRKDVFEENKWEIPTTWDQVLLLIPELQMLNLQFYLPLNQVGATSVVNQIFASYLYQSMDDTSQAFYRFYPYDTNGDGKDDKTYMTSNFDSEESLKAFEFWSSFYTNYSFPLAASFINRFRSGETPIGIAPFNIYNTLAVSAPEIRGKWNFALLPGTERLDSNGDPYVDYTSAASGTSLIMMEQRDKRLSKEEKEQKYNDSWNFMKWFTSKETQIGFAREIEAILGAAARHNTGTIEAFKELAWTNKELDILMKQWNMTVGVPEVPGGYYTGRNLENAFRYVVNKNENPRETLLDYIVTINKEINRKRREFGLGTLDEYKKYNK